MNAVLRFQLSCVEILIFGKILVKKMYIVPQTGEGNEHTCEHSGFKNE